MRRRARGWPHRRTAPGDVGGQELAAGLADEVRMDAAPVVFGWQRYFGRFTRSSCWRTPDMVLQWKRAINLR